MCWKRKFRESRIQLSIMLRACCWSIMLLFLIWSSFSIALSPGEKFVCPVWVPGWWHTNKRQVALSSDKGEGNSVLFCFPRWPSQKRVVQCLGDTAGQETCWRMWWANAGCKAPPASNGWRMVELGEPNRGKASLAKFLYYMLLKASSRHREKAAIGCMTAI